MEANKIIITGGATRIGAAIARRLSGPGVEIVIHFNKSKSNAEKLKKKLSKKKTKVYLVKGDLSKEKDVNKILKFMIKDKKNTSSLINLILLKKIGQSIIDKKFRLSDLKIFLKKELAN